MNCDETRPLLEAYLDGELDLVHSLAIEQHVETCADCQRLRERHEALRGLLRRTLPRPTAPAGLTGKIRRTLRREASATSGMPWRWLAAAALLLASMALFGMMSRSRVPGNDLLVAEAVANHVRSLLPGHLTDVASTDRHTVKPWVAQRVDYSPPVVDLTAAGFPLVGARLDYLDHRNVAALVYTCREHRMNVFVSPAAETQPERWTTRDGFHVVTWSRAGMRYVVVSDLAEAELREFARHLRDEAG